MRTRLLGRSAAFLFAGLGPRVMLAPDDGSGGGGGNAGAGGDSGGGAGGVQGAGAAGGGEPAAQGVAAGDGGSTSLLGSAPKPDGTKPDADAPAGSKPAGDRDTGEKVLGEDGKPKEGEGDLPADDVPKDIDGNALPEAYEFKMPDGFTADQAMMDLATPVFKEHRLSPGQAQAVADLYAKVTRDQVEKHMATVNGWKERAKTDKAFNEDGGYDKNLGLAHKGFHAYGNEELLQVFDTYGLGDHPAVLRMFRDIGKAVSETGTIGGDAATGQRSTADILYPSMSAK